MRLDCPCLDPRLWVCLVGGEIGRMEKKKKKKRENCWEKCLVGRGRGREFWWGPGVFSSGHQNTISPNWGENCVKIFGQNYPCQIPLCTCCCLWFLFFFF